MNQQALKKHVVDLLRSNSAHSGFDDIVKGIPAEVRGKRPRGLPHSPWEIVEHIRIGQWDILEYSRNRNHKSPKWPDEFWPPTPAPPSAAAWNKSLRGFRDDLDSMCALVSDPKTDLLAPIEWGDGHTILREALLAADHNSHHLGQLIEIRRLLGAWK